MIDEHQQWWQVVYFGFGFKPSVKLGWFISGLGTIVPQKLRIKIEGYS